VAISYKSCKKNIKKESIAELFSQISVDQLPPFLLSARAGFFFSYETTWPAFNFFVVHPEIAFVLPRHRIISTNPKNTAAPVFLSVITLAELTAPTWLNKVLIIILV